MKFYKTILVFCFLLVLSVGYAQDIKIVTKDNDLKLAALPYYNFGKGLGITAADSLFQFNIRFRMQNRISVIKQVDESLVYDAQIRRLRLRFDGYVGNPKFLYVIQLSFASGDVGEVHEGENVNIIRDAAFFYRPSKKWNFIFGQTKLPGNRQRVNSSGALQLTDRSINNARFNIDRDFGIQAYYLNERENKFSYNLKTAISTGEGRNWNKTPDSGLAFTGKVELLPLGRFSKDGIYFEGDLLKEVTPKIMFSAVYHQNNNARRTAGQFGDLLFEQRTIRSLLFDALLKYQGFSFMSAYMLRDVDNPITMNPLETSQQNYIYKGSGLDCQLGYIFLKDFELSGRYSSQTPHDDISNLMPKINQYSLGATKYIREHAFKLQTEFTLTDNQNKIGSNSLSWYWRFQLEIGI